MKIFYSWRDERFQVAISNYSGISLFAENKEANDLIRKVGEYLKTLSLKNYEGKHCHFRFGYYLPLMNWNPHLIAGCERESHSLAELT